MRYLLFALLLLTSPVHAEDGWFPYWFPADPSKAPDYMGIPASTFNAGKDVLDAPAGKHGFVQVKDGHFYFEDGTRARFWGTNLCFGACFPEKKDAEIMANRIAYFGFNAVRLHHMDMHFEPDGIFEDVAPAYKNKQMKPTDHLSPRQLDKLDYLIYQLKQRGIYININTLVSRFFTEADGVPDAEKLGMAAKPYSLFDRKLIELQKQYSKELLTHFNPYTKLRYCDDPAICLVEITNENTLTETNIGAMPEYYKNEISTMLDKWLIAKYGSLEKVKASWEPKKNLLEDPYKWTAEEHDGAALDIKKTDDGTEATITINNITGTGWHLQYRYSGIKLKKDVGYILRFTARSEPDIKICLVSQQAYDPWEWLGLGGNIDLNKDFRTFEVPFSAIANCSNSKIGFIIGNSIGTLTIKDIVLAESNKGADLKTFLSDTEKSYLKEMKDFLHSGIGIKCPVGIGGHWNPAQLELQKECLDYVDKHGYWDHPKFPNRSWDKNDFRMHNRSMLADKDLGIIGSFKKCAPKNMPYVISEWNHCYPNPYAYETPTLLAKTARQENWDGLFQFAWAHSQKDLNDYCIITNYFNINSNAQQLILCSYGSRIFLCGDKSKIPFVEQIKNNGDKWNDAGIFIWGSAPTLMKK